MLFNKERCLKKENFSAEKLKEWKKEKLQKNRLQRYTLVWQ